jgi:hypothetical protein
MTLRWSRRTTLALAGVAVIVLGVSGAAVAVSVSDDDASDTAIPGPARDRAESAALAETGGGRVTGTEVDDEESKYEVEVTLPDGSQVDVQLDEDFDVVGTEDEGGDEGGDG